MLLLVLATLFFIAIHVLIAGTQVRGAIISIIGEQAYLALFSLLSLLGLIWLSKKLAETKSKDDGSFDLTVVREKDGADVLYLITKGGEAKVGGGKGPNPAITLMATLGRIVPQRVTINELTTVASVWTGAQFLTGCFVCARHAS